MLELIEKTESDAMWKCTVYGCNFSVYVQDDIDPNSLDVADDDCLNAHRRKCPVSGSGTKGLIESRNKRGNNNAF
jgi:hypothetical protein